MLSVFVGDNAVIVPWSGEEGLKEKASTHFSTVSRDDRYAIAVESSSNEIKFKGQTYNVAGLAEYLSQDLGEYRTSLIMGFDVATRDLKHRFQGFDQENIEIRLIFTPRNG